MSAFNDFGQPIGPPLPDWTPPPFPPRTAMIGQFCELQSIDVERHAEELHSAYALDAEGRNWTYLPYGPFSDLETYRSWMAAYCLTDDPMFFAVIDKATGKAVGVASFCRIDPPSGCIEVGHIHYSERLKKRPAVTEAMCLMMERVFELGYRRYEWKCDALNAPSRAAADRLGFRYEGTFRQAKVYKNRSRDTAWFSVIDNDWRVLRRAFQTWLDPANFDDGGNQLVSLADLRRSIVDTEAGA